MKSCNWLAIGMLCVVAPWTASAVFAQQVPDTNFRPTVEHPAYVDRHPKILFDEAHLNVHTTQGTYKAITDLLTSDGYKITVGDKPFDAKTLAGYDVLLTSNARAVAQRSEKPAFTEQECEAVRDWVQAGGSLLLVVDHYPTGHAAENMARQFGVELSKGRTTDRAHAPPGQALGGAILFSRDTQTLGDHAITRGRDATEQVDHVVTFTGESLKGPPESAPLLILSETAIDFFPSDAAEDATSPPGGPRTQRQQRSAGDEPQKSAAGRSQGLAMRFGKGRVVVLGEASQLSAQRAGPRQAAMGMNFPNCDNRQWALNIMHWLTGLIE